MKSFCSIKVFIVPSDDRTTYVARYYSYIIDADVEIASIWKSGDRYYFTMVVGEHIIDPTDLLVENNIDYEGLDTLGHDVFASQYLADVVTFLEAIFNTVFDMLLSDAVPELHKQ